MTSRAQITPAMETVLEALILAFIPEGQYREAVRKTNTINALFKRGLIEYGHNPYPFKTPDNQAWYISPNGRTLMQSLRPDLFPVSVFPAVNSTLVSDYANEPLQNAAKPVTIEDIKALVVDYIRYQNNVVGHFPTWTEIAFGANLYAIQDTYHENTSPAQYGDPVCDGFVIDLLLSLKSENRISANNRGIPSRYSIAVDAATPETLTAEEETPSVDAAPMTIFDCKTPEEFKAWFESVPEIPYDQPMYYVNPFAVLITEIKCSIAAGMVVGTRYTVDDIAEPMYTEEMETSYNALYSFIRDIMVTMTRDGLLLKNDILTNNAGYYYRPFYEEVLAPTKSPEALPLSALQSVSQDLIAVNRLLYGTGGHLVGRISYYTPDYSIIVTQLGDTCLYHDLSFCLRHLKTPKTTSPKILRYLLGGKGLEIKAQRWFKIVMDGGRFILTGGKANSPEDMREEYADLTAALSGMDLCGVLSKWNPLK